MKWFTMANEKSLVTCIERINTNYKRFFEHESWYLYFVSVILIILSVYYFNLDLRKKNLLLQRRREMYREKARPLRARRFGASLKDHEIYRVVYDKVQQYLNPASLDKYKIHLNKNGEIIGITNTNVKTFSVNKLNGKQPIAPVSGATSVAASTVASAANIN